MGRPADLSVRRGEPADAATVAGLHADSWRRHYRGAYADAYLDGDIEAERFALWSERLAVAAAELDRGAGVFGSGSTCTLLAEDGGTCVGFVHVVFDADPVWGSLVDNLHVVSAHQRGGIGTLLLSGAAEAVVARGGSGLYLWVLEQNTAAQAFYAARGGRTADRRLVPPPGGRPERLHGSPVGLRIVWSDPAELLA